MAETLSKPAPEEVLDDSGIVTANVEQIGRVDRAELDLQPHLARPGLGHRLLADGQHVRRFPVAVETNSLHFASLTIPSFRSQWTVLKNEPPSFGCGWR